MISTRLKQLLFLLCSLQIALGTIERGQQLYNQVCFNCHGPELDGGIGPSLIDAYWKHGDSPEAILQSISKGIAGTEMIAYNLAFSENDLEALRDFILEKQEGNRQSLRSLYPRDYFKGKRLHPDLFDSVESTGQALLPENFFYVGRMFDGILRGQSKLYLKSPGTYRMGIGGGGRTSVWVNGEEVHYTNDNAKKSTHFNKEFFLDAGVHDLEILHEEKTAHAMKFRARLQNVKGGHWMLTGRSLEGNAPKIIRPGPVAKVVRKWIDGLPPRTLLLLLPNELMLAYDAESGKILKGWESSFVDQTPSLDSRSQMQSVVKGKELPGMQKTILEGNHFSLLHYETPGDSVKIATLVDGSPQSFTVSPAGINSYKISF